jgi:hypothetical protein
MERSNYGLEDGIVKKMKEIREKCPPFAKTAKATPKSSNNVRARHPPI